MILLIY